MGSQAVTKAVAKKLKYYVDIKRREDGFDLSGPYLPSQDPVQLRAGPTLAYDGLHDRSLKHYFRDPDVKIQVGKMMAPSSLQGSSRNMAIRRVLDKEMAKRSYSTNPGSNSPYVSPAQRKTTKHRPQALISVDQYLKTKKGSKQRKIKPDILGKPRKVLRRSPPRSVSKNEQERIVNMAARLIVATETAALPGNRSTQAKSDSSTHGSSLPEVNSKSSYTEDSSDSEMTIPSVCPRPPSRAGGPRPKWTPPRPNSVESEPTRGKTRVVFAKSPLALSDENSTLRQRSSKGTTKKNTARGGRPLTASAAVHKKDHQSSPYRPPRPRSAKYAYKNSGERVKDTEVFFNGDHDRDKERKKLQTYSTDSFDEEDNDTAEGSRQDNDEVDSKLFYKRSFQNKKPSRYRILTYQVYVVTGNQREAGTNADIKLTMFGDNCSSGERPLLKSMNHSRKFQKGQVDIFAVDSVYLGELQNIRIGHTQTSSEYGWFLETVFISEGPKEDTVFQFPCERWFSSQKDDGQILRDICVSELITESELSEKLDEYGGPGAKSSDEDSYSSSSSSDEYSDKPKDKDLSSDDHYGNKSDEKRSSRRKKSRSKKRGDKKRVSFQQDVEKNNDENKKSGHESHSESEESEKVIGRNSRGSTSDRSNSERSNSERSTSEGSSSEDEDNRRKKSKNKKPKSRDLKNKDDDEKKSEVDESETQKTEEEKFDVKTPEGKTVKSSFEDDFWSNDAGKPEQIHYDLDVKKDKERSKGTSSSDSGSDDERKSTSNDDGQSGDHAGGSTGSIGKQTEDDNRNKDGNIDSPNDKNEDEGKSKGSTDDYMAGFMAGVKASEHDNDHEEHHEETDDQNNLNESIEDEDFILRKGASLHTAVANGDLERVKELLQHDQALRQQTDEKGWIPLHVGCSNGQLDCVKLIAVSGGNLEEETPTGYTSMHLAAMNGHVNCMMVLFALGAEINCRTIDEYTPLHLAAMSGHVECVKWLLANRAKPDVADVNGRTPAQIAEEYCYEEVAKLLKSFKKELTRTDSTLAHLMTYEGTRKKSADSASKVSDSGMGGLESGEESWVSDNENEEQSSQQLPGRSARPSSAKRVSSASSDGSVRSKNITDSITTVEEKQKLYEKQRQQMKKRHSSFLDSIRMDVEDEIQPDHT